jgi:hypothetical protein
MIKKYWSMLELTIEKKELLDDFFNFTHDIIM